MKMIQFKSIPTSPLLLCYQLQNWKQDGQHLSVLFHKGPPHFPQDWILMLWGRLKVHKAQVSLQYVIFTSYLHNQSTLKDNLNRFWKLQFRATTFVVDLFLEFGHVATLPMTYWLDSDRYNHRYVLFLHLLVRKHQYSLLGHLPLDLNASLNNIDQHSYFFLLIFSLLYLFFI